MFGYQQGAFTGAERRKRGKFEQANGGLLFLDEIGDMSLPLRSKLLHVLQGGDHSLLGSEKTVKMGAWLVAAANYGLEKDNSHNLIRNYLTMSSVMKYYLGNRRIIFLLFIAYFGLAHSVFSAGYNPFAENVERLRIRAKAGDAEAQFMLGKFYYYGFCVERNYKEAIKWFRAAAIQGHASAQFLLGEAYQKGKGLERDYAQAAKWYERAAFQGHYLAIPSLSYLYAHGLGVRKNLINAYAWNKLIAAQDWDTAKSLKIELEKIMNQEQLNLAQILSIELKKKIRAPLQ